MKVNGTRGVDAWDRQVGNPDAVKAVVDAMRKHIKVPLVLQTCGRLVKAPNANTGDERSLPPGSA
jgi:hypothetical protein